MLFTIDLRTGAIKVLLHSTDWVNHLLFSPTDPELLMYCHEGPWQKVDRIWTIHTDGTHNTLIHKRTMFMEIAGHEFWGHDGKTIWYDWQTPKGEDFWLAGYNVETGKRTAYHMQRNEWSIHFNVSSDATLFCGDGGDPGQVAHAPDGEWIYLFHPEIKTGDGINLPRLHPARRLPCGAPRKHVEAQLPPGAERQLHSRPEVGDLPLEYVRTDLCICRGSRQERQPGKGRVTLQAYPHLATISVTSSCCSPGLKRCTSSTIAATLACAVSLQCRRRASATRCSPNSSPSSLHASVTPSV